jgi:hypothetical protein
VNNSAHVVQICFNTSRLLVWFGQVRFLGIHGGGVASHIKKGKVKLVGVDRYIEQR